MKILRYQHFVVAAILYINVVNSEKANNKDLSKENNKSNCSYTKVIKDIFKINNKTTQAGSIVENNERTKIFLDSFASKTNKDSNKTSIEEFLVNNIIASINRIKNNITSENGTETKLNEAIILNSSKRKHNENGNLTKIETNNDAPVEDIKKDEIRSSTTERPNYVEILTIEPNNTSRNNSSTNNIIQMLKHLMPMFNTTLTNEIHNITIIETNRNNNHSISAMRNVSKIVVTYCDSENFTKLNTSVDLETDVDIKIPADDKKDDDYYVEADDSEFDENYDDFKPINLTVGEKKDIMEATEYGMQKMHELYSIMEPKLYSMGLWLEDANPARYVAAFNAPSEDVAKYSRYGYASLQAATRLKQLTSNGYNDGLEGRAEETQFPSVSALRQSPLLEHCPLRGAPKCPPASKRYRTHDGTCNNFNRPRWGSTKTPVQRFQPPAYSDGLQAPRRSVFGSKLPSAREISSLIHEDQNVEASSITHLLMQWGQFLDHDITSTSQSRGFNGSVPRCCKDGGRDFVPREFMHPECLPISVPASDPFYGPKGVRCLDFVRSSPAPRDDCALGWREQLNQVSAYIDASPVYASSARQSDKLRLFRNGMLQYGRVQHRRPLLPRERRDSLCRGGAVSADCFRSGDARVNEHPGLVAAHIIWLRQHNRMAQELAHLNPQWSDEKIYQETRKIVGAMIQHITYREFLPIVLGEEVMRLFELEPQRKGYFKGYNPKVNPSPASSFGSAAFRFGHSLVQSSMVRYDKFHRPLNNNVSLHDELTNPSNIWSMGAVDRLLLGMVNQPIQKRDEFITVELTNHLFQTPSFDFGMDLAAINIQRGRDHGIASYTSWREPCGLSTILDFEDLFRVMPARTVRKIQALYRHVDDIDLFTGGMAERPVVGGLVGPTFSCIIAQQFSNLRKGDRFWYENGGFESSFTPAQLQQIRRITFAQVLCRTLDNINDIQPFVFLSSESPDNDRISCRNALFNNFDLSPWTEINSDSNNDISKTDDDDPTTQRPKKTKRPNVSTSTTTTRSPTSTKKTDLETAASNNVDKKQKPLTSLNSTTIRDNKFKPTVLFNKTDTESTDKNNTTNLTKPDNTTNLTKPDMVKLNTTETKIDDKLDFKNKSRRYEEIDRIDQRHNYNRPNNYDYDDDDEVQSVQSVVINNVSNKRPYNRPVISVTENIDKFTYLINYVPRPTQSWRQTTRRNFDRDVVKVTYQNYDDTYRRPNKPYYYNRHDDKNYDNYRRNRPTDSHDTHLNDDESISSARSRDYQTQTTAKTDSLLDRTFTTENVFKLVTFGYVGTYKGDRNDRPTTVLKTNDKKDIDSDKISKDFSTDDFGKSTTSEDSIFPKLSTFYHYETATRPYNLLRPTRRNDEPDSRSTSGKYYYVQNKLHKYPNIDFTMTDRPTIDNIKRDIIKENYNTPGNPSEEIEERSAVDIDAFVDEVDSKSTNSDRLRIKLKKPSGPAKTPSVAFQIIPSENSPSHWAVFEEEDDLPAFSQKMPSINKDPQASKEIPRPMDFKNLRRRKPGNI